MSAQEAFASCDHCLGALPFTGTVVVPRGDGSLAVFCDELCETHLRLCPQCQEPFPCRAACCCIYTPCACGGHRQEGPS